MKCIRPIGIQDALVCKIDELATHCISSSIQLVCDSLLLQVVLGEMRLLYKFLMIPPMDLLVVEQTKLNLVTELFNNILQIIRRALDHFKQF